MAMKATFKEWSQGTDIKDVVAAGAGLAASTMLPGFIVKDTTTTSGKIFKLIASAGAALIAGFAVKSIAGPSAGKAAVLGGLAGTATQAINLFRPGTIGAHSIGRPVGRIGIPYNTAPNSPTDVIVSST